MKRLLLFILILNISILPIFAKHLHYEKEYQEVWCSANKGITEYKLEDYTRVDCLTPNYAVEFDFANKWAESIGQSLYYGLSTNRNPAVVLIMENPQKEQKYLKRLNKVANKFGIKVITMESLEDIKYIENEISNTQNELYSDK